MLVKSIDLPIGFVIGFLSDATRTRWGRRRPYIALGAPIIAVALVLFSRPPGNAGVARSSKESHLCQGLRGNCSAISDCVEHAVEEGLIPKWTDFVTSSIVGESAGPQLAVWFLACRFALFICGHTIVTVPYDALGMELTTNYDQRSRLFGVKGLFGLLGNLCQVITLLVMSRIASSDIELQARVLGMFGAMAWAVGATVCLCIVKERQRTEMTEDEPPMPPFVPAVREMLRNGPYVNYVCIRFTFAFAIALMLSSFGFWLKYVIQVENSVQMGGMLQLTAIATAALQVAHAAP